MGIQGLLPTLKTIITPVHVRVYAGKKAAIDTYSWLHKAAFTCSKDVCEGRVTDKFIDYCMHRVNLLRHYGVQPVLVFDGGVLPMKAEQEAKRARSRKENLERAHEHERVGNHLAANECYQRAVDITPALASRLIKVLRREGVEYVVAPYEADAQMAYLALHGLVDVIITEDSDLIAYGCPWVLFKMNKSGQGDEFKFSDLVRNKDLSFANFTKQMVLEMCVMTGCDYLPSLPGMGVKKAHGLIRRFKGYQKVIRHLRFSGVTVSAHYEDHFEKALLTFRHQRVYDPVRQALVHLTEIPSNMTLDLEFLGPDLNQILVKAIAEGEVDPSTCLPFQEAATAVDPGRPKFGHKSSTQQNITKTRELLAPKNVLTNYFSKDYQKAKKQFKVPRMVQFIVEQQTKNFPAKDTLGSPFLDTQDAMSLVEEEPNVTEVFGTPLPDDDDEYESSALHEIHVMDVGVLEEEPNVTEVFGTPLPGDDDEYESNALHEIHNDRLDFALYDGIGRKTGVKQDVSDSSAFQQEFSPSRAITGRISEKERKKRNVDESQVKLSVYFPHPRSMYSELVKPDAARKTTTDYSDICGREETKKSRVEHHDIIFEKVKEGSSDLVSPSEGLSDDIGLMNRKSRETNVFEKWNRPSPLSKVAGEGGTSELGRLSSDVSHVDQFAHVAQKSIERFVAAIAPFRCASRGSRASGLRAPMSIISKKPSVRIWSPMKRIAEKGQSTLDSTLSQFWYQSSNFKPPSRSLNIHVPH